jgi:NTE family protein
MIQRISELTLEKYQPDLLIRISSESFSIFDFYKANEIIREGEEATVKAIHKAGHFL